MITLVSVQKSDNHIVITDTEGIVVYANHGAEITTGYSAKEMNGNTPRLWGGLMSRGEILNLIICQPPRTAKSPYSSTKSFFSKPSIPSF